MLPFQLKKQNQKNTNFLKLILAFSTIMYLMPVTNKSSLKKKKKRKNFAWRRTSFMLLANQVSGQDRGELQDDIYQTDLPRARDQIPLTSGP